MASSESVAYRAQAPTRSSWPIPAMLAAVPANHDQAAECGGWGLPGNREARCAMAQEANKGRLDLVGWRPSRSARPWVWSA